jgi:protein-S-isoprenylcysteine O-methyltransferase Ste14
MPKLVTFALLTVALIYVSRNSLRAPGSHGFYRFFAWEAILALFLLNVDIWFLDPFSTHQILSWVLLIVSVLSLVFGVRDLASKGDPVKSREGDGLLAFEKTTTLVTTGIYRYIRHPLYSSLLLFAWGAFFKAPAWFAGLLVLSSTLLIFATAKADEAECIRFFGPSYRSYMKQSKMFIPFLL